MSTNASTPRWLLIDGSNLLFQMFYGMPARITGANGRPIQGTLGFMGALLKIIRMISPTHVGVIFDGEHANPRAALDPDYKANRPDYSGVPDDELPFSQLPDICAALDCLGIPHAETTDCETDDILAAYAQACAGEVVIASFDSDYFQLITDRVSVLRYRGEKTVICTPDTIREKFGIEPGQYADFKALVGDNSDNIRGAEKIGPKTAAALLAQFGTLEGILARVGEITRPAIRTSIVRDADRLQRNLALIRLDGTAALPFPPDALVYTDRGLTTTDVLRRIGLK